MQEVKEALGVHGGQQPMWMQELQGLQDVLGLQRVKKVEEVLEVEGGRQAEALQRESASYAMSRRCRGVCIASSLPSPPYWQCHTSVCPSVGSGVPGGLSCCR